MMSRYSRAEIPALAPNSSPPRRRGLRLSRPRPDPPAVCAALLEAVAERAGDFDVIHSHLDWVHLPLLRRLRTPFLTTLHGRLDLPDLPMTAQRFADAPFVSISQSQRAPLLGMNWLATIHHGLPPDLLKLSERPEGYLAFLGRIRSRCRHPPGTCREAAAAHCRQAAARGKSLF